MDACFASIETDIAPLKAADIDSVRDFSHACDQRLRDIQLGLSQTSWIIPTELPQNPTPILDALADKLEEQARLESEAEDATLRSKLSAERGNLSAREWLESNKDLVLRQINRHKQISLLKLCKKDTSTRAITDKHSELTAQLATEAFCKQFEQEVLDLGLRTLSVKMELTAGRKGETIFGLRIVNAADSHLTHVASEGEQRCIALAAFLAELSLASHRSALVFDDPVSSLDHRHRERIAARLTKEAMTRQIIVFTHDPVLVHELEHHANLTKVSTKFRHLEWDNGKPGRCQEGLPWDLEKPPARFDMLGKRQRDLERRWQPSPTKHNSDEMKNLYSLLRATLERLVEREVFADVIFRFRSYIKINQLCYVTDFPKTECDEILRLFDKFCNVTDAHDCAMGKHAQIPDPTELAGDIKALQTVYDSIHNRQNTTRKNRHKDKH